MARLRVTVEEPCPHGFVDTHPVGGRTWCPGGSRRVLDSGSFVLVPSFEELDLLETPPEATYLVGNDRVWVGRKWDIAQTGDRWEVYRKGNFVCSVESEVVARAIVADGLDALEGEF